MSMSKMDAPVAQRAVGLLGMPVEKRVVLGLPMFYGYRSGQLLNDKYRNNTHRQFDTLILTLLIDTSPIEKTFHSSEES